MHDINGSNSTLTTPEMGAYLSYSITAKGKDGNVLKNYTKTCFPDIKESSPYNAAEDCPQVNGLKLNTTFDLDLNADINSSMDANISLYTEYNATSPIYTPQKNLTITAGSNAIKEWISPLNFTDGIGKAKVYFNIDRKVDVALNPIIISVKDVNTSTSWMTNSGSPKDFNGTTLNTSKNFIYGRVIARDVRIFGQKPFRVNAWYEAFSQTPLTIGGAALAPSRTDTNWYIMAPHVDTTDGDANVTYVVTSSSTTTPNIGGASAAGVEIYNFAAQTPPYSAKAHINTEAWLWYGINALDYADPSGANLDCFTHPCFNINVVPEVGATGSAKQDAADSKANKRTGGETGGTWKSTSDYAPAVR